MKSVSETNVARDKSEVAPTLQICLIPRTTWGNNVRSHVPNTTWRAIRRDVIRRAGEKCEACESQADPLHCHEVFDFDTHQGLQRLVGLRALCPSCHGVVHIGRTLAREGKRAFDASLEHLARVNGWTEMQTLAHFDQAVALWETRSTQAWQVVLPPEIVDDETVTPHTTCSSN
jgi:hypothetical protein